MFSFTSVSFLGKRGEYEGGKGLLFFRVGGGLGLRRGVTLGDG